MGGESGEDCRRAGGFQSLSVRGRVRLVLIGERKVGGEETTYARAHCEAKEGGVVLETFCQFDCSLVSEKSNLVFVIHVSFEWKVEHNSPDRIIAQI